MCEGVCVEDPSGLRAQHPSGRGELKTEFPVRAEDRQGAQLRRSLSKTMIVTLLIVYLLITIDNARNGLSHCSDTL